MIRKANLGVDGFIKASNYINKKGEHPKILSAIVWYNIVLRPEELNDNNWLYIGKESEKKIKGQLWQLKLYKDCVSILEG